MITVKDAVLCAAGLLGIEESVEKFFGSSVTQEERDMVDGLTECFNIVENELAMDYLPLVYEESILADGKTFGYAGFQKSVLGIVAVLDEDGNRVHFKQAADGLKIPEGSYTVRYTALPAKKAMGDCSEYSVGVSERVFAYGIAAEYCLHKGYAEEAAVWEKKYKQALKGVRKTSGSWTVKVGKWI